MTKIKNQFDVSIVPPPKGRLQAPLSIVRGVKNINIVQQTTYIEQRNKMLNDKDLKHRTKKLRELKQSDATIYKEEKEASCGFISGKMDKRNDKEILEYSPLMWFDVDGLQDMFYVEMLLEECKKIPEVFAAFPSLSGCGLRIGIWTESNLQIHKEVYKAICKYLSEKLSINKGTGEKIDTSTSNPSRLFFECHVDKEHFYENIKSKIFSLPSKLVKTSLKTTKKTPTSNQKTISESEKINLCKLIVESTKGIAEGRNNYVFALACKMWEHGVSEQVILSNCMEYQSDDFSKAEIKKTVTSATKKATFKRFNDAQLLNWKSKVIDSIEKKIEAPEEMKEEPQRIELHGGNKFVKIENYLIDNFDLRRNIISHDIEYIEKNGKDQEYRIFNESDLEIELLREGITGIKEPINALLSSSVIREYDPFKDYYKNLPKWKEGDQDYINDLANYVNAKDQDWFNYQFKKMLVRSLACATKVIPFNKQCFTLVGKQNDGKTSFLRFLCPPQLDDYIKDNPFFANKDGLLTLVQNLFINLDELANISKYDINQIKKIFTMDSVKERLPYARKPERFSRRASFLGSTNSSEFLTDPTGNVRWLVLDIDGIHHDNGGSNGYNQNIDIDKVWSQAYTLLKNGFEYRLTKEDIEKSEVNNKNYQVTSIEAELIQDRFIASTKENSRAEFLRTSQILELIDPSNKYKIKYRNLGMALRQLGFKQEQKFLKEIDGKIKNQQRKGYYVIDLKEG